MDAACVRAASGFHGKLPWTGDFVQRRLPQDLVQAWDQHLVRLLPLLPPWVGGPDPVARPWAFLCAPGVCGAAAFAGVVAPGIDRVGRRFPLLLACPVRADADAGGLLRATLPWFAAATALQVAVRSGALAGSDDFDARVAALPGGDDAHDDDPNTTVPQALAARALRVRLEGWACCLAERGSLWWRDPAAVPCLLPALPDVDHCLRALQGEGITEVDA